MKTIDPTDNGNGAAGSSSSRTTFPAPDATVAGWLAQLKKGRDYSSGDICMVTGAKRSTLRNFLYRECVPEDAQPKDYDRRGHVWSYTRAVAFLKWLGRYCHLADAFEGEALLTAQQAAGILSTSVTSFRWGVHNGRYPEATVARRGRHPALWDPADIEAVLAGTYERPT